MVLTVQTAEVTTRTGNRETLGAGMEMVERFLLHGGDGQRTWLSVDIADEHTTQVPTALAYARLAICNVTVVRTELALNPTVVQMLVIAAFFHQYTMINEFLENNCFVDVEFSIAPTIPT